MTPADRVEAIRAFGYTPREAAFLAEAMLHSGYFVARQFTFFTGASMGKAVAQLTARLLTRRHAAAIATRQGQHVYHVSAKHLYAAINGSDGRNWSRRSPLAIKTRLMSLDYVLSHRDEEFFGTQADRIEYFVGVLGIDRSRLPRRHFADRSQIGVVNHPPKLSFVYFAEAGSSLSCFGRYLQQHRALFNALTASRIVFASDSVRLFDEAGAVFRRFAEGEAATCASAAETSALLEYFRIRRCYEAGQLAGFTKATLDQLREDRQRFQGARVENAYGRWVAGGDAAVRDAFETEQTSLDGVDLRFETHWLNHSYAQCGTRSD